MATELPEGTSTHRAEGDRRPTVRCAIVTVSDSRTADTDTSGARMRELLETTGYAVIDATLLPNDEARVRAHVVALVGRGDVDAILLTGGTGLGQRDRTIEAVRPFGWKDKFPPTSALTADEAREIENKWGGTIRGRSSERRPPRKVARQSARKRR